MATWSIVRFKVLANDKIEVAFADCTTGVATSPRAYRRDLSVTGSTLFVTRRCSQRHIWNTAR